MVYPLLFVMYINDLDLKVGSMISKFTDDMEISGAINSEEESLKLQDDVGELARLAEQWQMEFNPEKCEVMHFWRTNKAREYTMNGRIPFCGPHLPQIWSGRGVKFRPMG